MKSEVVRRKTPEEEELDAKLAERVFVKLCKIFVFAPIVA